MKGLLLLIIAGLALQFGAPKLGITLPWQSPLSEQAETAYIKYANGVTAMRYQDAIPYATGDAANLTDDRNRFEKWLQKGNVVAKSKHVVKTISSSSNSIEFVTTYFYVPNTDLNPGNPKSWRSNVHKVTMEKVGESWKVAKFSIQE